MTVVDNIFNFTGERINIHYQGICGDDEDALLKDWVQVAVYLGAHKVHGFNLNPNKQLTDWYNHEFLQRVADKNTLPRRPIAPMLAQFTTGSWYKISRDYYDTAIPSMNGILTELIGRGANKLSILKVGACMLDRMYQIQVHNEFDEK